MADTPRKQTQGKGGGGDQAQLSLSSLLGQVRPVLCCIMLSHYRPENLHILPGHQSDPVGMHFFGMSFVHDRGHLSVYPENEWSLKEISLPREKPNFQAQNFLVTLCLKFSFFVLFLVLRQEDKSSHKRTKEITGFSQRDGMHTSAASKTGYEGARVSPR